MPKTHLPKARKHQEVISPIALQVLGHVNKYIESTVRFFIGNSPAAEDLASDVRLEFIKKLKTVTPENRIMFGSPVYLKRLTINVLRKNGKKYGLSGRYALKVRKKVLNAEHKLTMQLGKTPTDVQVAKELGISISRLAKIRDSSTMFVSLDHLRSKGFESSDYSSGPMAYISKAEANDAFQKTPELFEMLEKKILMDNKRFGHRNVEILRLITGYNSKEIIAKLLHNDFSRENIVSTFGLSKSKRGVDKRLHSIINGLPLKGSETARALDMTDGNIHLILKRIIEIVEINGEIRNLGRDLLDHISAANY